MGTTHPLRDISYHIISYSYPYTQCLTPVLVSVLRMCVCGASTVTVAESNRAPRPVLTVLIWARKRANSEEEARADGIICDMLKPN